MFFELFEPRAWLLNARYGAHLLGVEYQADVAEVRATLAERGIRIVRDVDMAVHTHPADTCGVAFEFYAGALHDRSWPALGVVVMQPAAHWRDAHLLGLTRRRALTLAVADADAASALLQDFLAARVLGAEPRPALNARAVSLEVADSAIEVVAPVANGILRDHLRRYGDGLRSVVFGVADLDAAARYLDTAASSACPAARPGRWRWPWMRAVASCSSSQLDRGERRPSRRAASFDLHWEFR